MRIRRWGDEEERPVAELGPNATLEVLIVLGILLFAGWIVSRPVTTVQNVDHWPEPVAAEVGR